MKRTVALILTLMMCLPLCACGSKHNPTRYPASSNEPETTRIDTAYPEYICETNENYVTVEMAIQDLYQLAEQDATPVRTNDCLKRGDLSFDDLTYNYPDYDSFEAIFWFDIVVPYEYGSENFRAKVIYNYREGNGLTLYDYELWQIDSDFSETGVWSYDDGETHIWINYLRKDDTAYVVEYDITYYYSSWTNSGWVSDTSNGEVKVYGENQWDGEDHYLSIELRGAKNEVGEEVDLGNIKVYPQYGVFWDALHSDGGPYRLEQ